MRRSQIPAENLISGHKKKSWPGHTTGSLQVTQTTVLCIGTAIISPGSLGLYRIAMAFLVAKPTAKTRLQSLDVLTVELPRPVTLEM